MRTSRNAKTVTITMPTKPPTPAQKAAATRLRNKWARREAALEAEALVVFGWLQGGTPLVYKGYQAGYQDGDGRQASSGVVRHLLRTERAKKDEDGKIWLSSPAEYAAGRDRQRRKDDANERHWLAHWRGRVRAAADDATLDIVIRDLIGWGNTHDLTDAPDSEE